MRMITLEMTEAQANTLVNLLDTATRAGGLQVAAAAAELHALLGAANEASLANEPESKEDEA